ncbi:MAG: Ferredoxin-sulfite reductase, partial [Cyanobacteriota bacterium]
MTAGQSATGGAVGPEAGTRDLAPSQLSPCIASGAERSKFEQFKADSGYLHDPLAEELANDANHFSEGAVQLLKFHGSYQQDNRENRQKGRDKDW